MTGLKSTIVVDIDDVVLHHRAHLARFLQGSGIELARGSSALDWWLVASETGEILSDQVTEDLLARGFLAFAHNQEPIEGAIEALNNLAEEHSVIFLTNFPSSMIDVRVRRLNELNLEIPVFENIGGKGKFVQLLQQDSDTPIIFVDDSERQIRNVKKHSPYTKSVRADIVESWREENMIGSSASAVACSWSDIVRFVERETGSCRQL